MLPLNFIILVHAIFGIAVFVLWLCFYTDWPDLHRRVSCAELSEIHDNKGNAHIEMGQFCVETEVSNLISTACRWQCARRPNYAQHNNACIMVLRFWLLAFCSFYASLLAHLRFLCFGLLDSKSWLLDSNWWVDICNDKTKIWLEATFAYVPLKLVFGYLSDTITWVVINISTLSIDVVFADQSRRHANVLFSIQSLLARRLLSTSCSLFFPTIQTSVSSSSFSFTWCSQLQALASTKYVYTSTSSLIFWLF